MSDIETKHRLQNIERDISELRSKTARLPVQLAKVQTGFSVTVYEFRNCDDPVLLLYLDNPIIAEHDPGEVAVINRDGVYDCWRLIGPAPFCKTGECGLIVAWGANCDACNACFYLTPCGGGSPIFVRGIDWYDYVGSVVVLEIETVETCLTVAVADGCFDVTDYTTDDIIRTVANCDSCGVYQLEHCADEELSYVSADLAAVVGAASGAASVGSFVKHAGKCYEIVDFVNPPPSEPTVWNVDDVTEIGSCSGCCYLLTPCEGQAGDPDPIYLRLADGDEVNPDDFLDGNESNGRVIMLTGYICYTWSVPEVCDEEEVIVGIPTVLEEFDSCEDCAITCWKECGTTTYIRTYSDMTEVGPNAAAKRGEDNKCYVRETSPGTCGEPAIVEFTILEVFDAGEDSCTICQTPKVELTPACGSSCPDCSGSSSGGSSGVTDAIVTDDSDLFGAVGQYVKVDGHCYFVEWTTDAVTQADVCFTGPFTSCEACAAAPTKKRVVTDIYFDESGNLVKEYADLYGSFNVCGTGSENIADSEECEE